MVSEIWGFRVNVGTVASGLALCGDFHTAAFSDIWVRFPGGKPDSFFGAMYQSILRNLKSANTADSRFLREVLRHNPEQLSIKFNVDGLDDSGPSSPYFTFGRVVGSIGLHHEEEPKHFVFGRQLLPATGFGIAYSKLIGDNLFLDLGNTLPTSSAGGPLATQPPLYVALLGTGPDFPLGAKTLAQLPTLDLQWYQQTAGIVSIPLNKNDVAACKANPLAVISLPPAYPPAISVLVSDQGPNPQTTAPGQFVRADQFVYRFNPETRGKVTHLVDFYVTQYGEPAKAPISLAADPSLMEGFVNQGTPISGPPVGIPAETLTWAKPVATKTPGKYTLAVSAANPGNPRGYIDGQVYGITYGLGTTPPAKGAVQNPSQILSALVFTAYPQPPQPNWVEHISPIFQQYANLYPIMKPIVDLGNFSSVVGKIGILKRVFSAQVTDPNYMPVTRDLSDAKKTMIRTWLNRPLYMNLDSVDDVKVALQTAVELEHATIPTYLTALYSIKPGRNPEVASLIQSVVMEEMLHMHLVSNILISIGGSPQIGRPGFMPNYPGSLPAGLRGNLTVRLRRCSIEHIRDCFLSIEEPEETQSVVHGAVKPKDAIDPHQFTIKWFYDEILCALEQLGDKVTYGNLDKQVIDRAAFPIKSFADAKRAINEIIQQGEGAGPLNPDAGNELAHFYKFSEIVAGRKIVVSKDGFAYTGAPIPFDPEGVWPMMDDPNLSRYPAGSRAQILSLQFAQTYQAMLNALNTTFNGEPQRINDAVGLMFSLSLAARQLMEVPSGLNDGTTAGPSFQLPIPGLAT